VTTHLRARWAQAGALLAVVVGGIAVAPAVALADPPDVQITSLSTDVLSGSSVSMSFHVSPANGGGAGQSAANIKVTGMDCQGVCSQIAAIGQDGKDFSVTLKAPTVNAGGTKTVTVTVTATINGESNSANQPVNVKGPDKPQTVTSISGKVRDQNNKAISGANVAMKDSGGHSYSTTTNGSGGYSFNSSDAQPISPGTISVGALKDGFDTATVSVQASAGKSVSVPLTLKAVAATASASPSVTASAVASAAATDDTATEDPAAGDTAPANTNTNSASADQGGSFGSTLFLVLGGLLVAGGVGAIVLVLMRRKNNDGSGPDDDPTAMGGGGGVVPPSQGRFNDATRVASPMGAGPAQTMMAPRAASSPMADAPTMLHRPVEDEFPDPYGAPVPRQGGNQYGGGSWDDQQQPAYGAGVPGGGTQQYGGGTQYGEPTQYGQAQDDGYGGGNYGAAAPAGGGQYGAAAAPAGGGQYGAAAAPAGGGQYGGGAQRYDEPTGMYRPEADQGGYDDYDQRGGGQYGGAQYGGGQYGGYDQASYGDQGAYEQGGYGDQGGQRGTYGGGQHGGGGYEQGVAVRSSRRIPASAVRPTGRAKSR